MDRSIAKGTSPHKLSNMPRTRETAQRALDTSGICPMKGPPPRRRVIANAPVPMPDLGTASDHPRVASPNTDPNQTFDHHDKRISIAGGVEGGVDAVEILGLGFPRGVHPTRRQEMLWSAAPLARLQGRVAPAACATAQPQSDVTGGLPLTSGSGPHHKRELGGAEWAQHCRGGRRCVSDQMCWS